MIALYVCLGLAAFIALIAWFCYLNNNWLTVSEHKICLPKISEQIKIVHISDLHGKRFGKENAKLIKKIIEIAPDYICITGDIIHKYTEKNKEAALEFVSAAAEIAQVLYVSGNHEMRNKGYRFFRRSLQDAGATVLDNRAIALGEITFVGLNCASLKNSTITKITPDTENKILLAHMPHFFEKYAASGYEIVLCGHAHGGQWRIPFTGVGFYAPGQGFFPKYTSGRHISGKTSMIVSRGLGNSECPLRLFNRPELVVVDIAPQTEK